MRNAKVIAGSSHEELAALIVQKLGMSSAPISIKVHSNQETAVELKVSVRNQDIFIIQSGSESTNDHLMELLVLIQTCRASSAGRITAVLPYLPYSKQSKRKRSRGAITAKLVANMLTVAGVDHIITMDLHHDQMQGFFTKPVDNLLSEPTFCKYIYDQLVPQLNNSFVIVSKNPGGVKRATSLADRLRCDFAIIHQENSEVKLARKRSISTSNSQTFKKKESSLDLPNLSISTDNDQIGSLQNSALTESLPLYSSTYAGEFEDSMHVLEVIEKDYHEDGLQLVGDVHNRPCIIIDDIVDRAESFMSAAALLQRKGASKVFVVGTHGLLSGDALVQFEDCSAIQEIIVTNTYPIPASKREASTKLRIIDISNVLAEAIRRTHNGESISYLFHTAM